MNRILPQIYVDKHGSQLSEILGDAYLLHSQIYADFFRISDGTGLALSARSDEFSNNHQTSLQA